MTNIETILLTNLFHFELDGQLKENEEFIKLTRRSALNSLQMDYKELQENEIDLTDDYKETINYIKQLTDHEYEELKQSILQFEKIETYVLG
ncbi:hypothetical protein DIX59_09050 [Streptococcus iniae]|uniref:hypothetical protein n=1 Tax=Streptococcus iniae TaxID=1346 RepID=UPI00030E982A|nr:hypothetical protein [Streptococcus iniae]ESR10523.1 sigma 70 family protein [Streptococcus iniae IUSA1]KYJ81240.1 hypothetical protein NA30_04375 [Streptococcus iniae]RMI73087.1 hypothetical protein DIX59_09050 [Streptococcus iniae]HEK4517267.1 hypothetical protein [Streptococcus iniae]